ncbi:MAG: hypothetical protein K0S41_3076 [Anaerocolumna sp.]|jgi:hypothetical protein|nr:hypothetical protein [Anaerocolumna sp.]
MKPIKGKILSKMKPIQGKISSNMKESKKNFT